MVVIALNIRHENPICRSYFLRMIIRFSHISTVQEGLGTWALPLIFQSLGFWLCAQHWVPLEGLPLWSWRNVGSPVLSLDTPTLETDSSWSHMGYGVSETQAQISYTKTSYYSTSPDYNYQVPSNTHKPVFFLWAWRRFLNVDWQILSFSTNESVHLAVLPLKKWMHIKIKYLSY